MGMTHIVDRRLNGKNKSAVNRERFLRRYRHHIKRAVSDAVLCGLAGTVGSVRTSQKDITDANAAGAGRAPTVK